MAMVTEWCNIFISYGSMNINDFKALSKFAMLCKHDDDFRNSQVQMPPIPVSEEAVAFRGLGFLQLSPLALSLGLLPTYFRVSLEFSSPRGRSLFMGIAFLVH